VALTTRPYLAPRLRKEHAIPLLPLWAFVACSRINFTLPCAVNTMKEEVEIQLHVFFITFVLDGD
jgi:hypothetical protein